MRSSSVAGCDRAVDEITLNRGVRDRTTGCDVPNREQVDVGAAVGEDRRRLAHGIDRRGRPTSYP